MIRIFLTSVLLFPLAAAAQAPDWAVDPAPYEASMNVTAAVVVDGRYLAHPGDRLAVFVTEGGTESLRGVAAPVSEGGRQAFYLTAYGHVENEGPLSYRVYDAAKDTVVTLSNQLAFAPNGIYGRPSAPYVFTNARSTGRPNWSVEPEGHESSMSVVAAVYIEGRRLQHPESLLAVFDGHELRGVAEPTRIDGWQVFFLTVYGAALETPELQLKVYAAEFDRTLDLAEPIRFEANTIAGRPTAPLALNFGSRGPKPEWEAQLVKKEHSMNVVAAVFPKSVRAQHPDDLLAAFVEVDGQREVRGVARPVQTDGRNVFFLTVYGSDDDVAAQRTVSFAAFAYDPETERTDTLDLAESLLFTTGGLTGRASRPFALNTRQMGAGAPTSWGQFSSAEYERSMSVTAALYVPAYFAGLRRVRGGRSDHPGDRIAAFIEGELRGVAAPEVLHGENVFFLSIWGAGGVGHGDRDAPITFKAYVAAADTVVTLEPNTTVAFGPDRALGSLRQPIALNSASLRPSVSVNLDKYALRMTINGRYDGAGGGAAAGAMNGPTLTPGDLVVAYAGNDVRGHAVLRDAAPASPGMAPHAGGGPAASGPLLFSMEVGGESEGETLAFKTVSQDGNRVLSIEQTLVFDSTPEDGATGSESNPIPLSPVQALEYDVRVLLGGGIPTGAHAMRTDLADQGLVPLSQPFSDPVFDGTPLEYDAGSEEVTTWPANAVDWVLVEVRSGTAASSTLAQRAGLLLSDGRIVHTDGMSALRFYGLAEGAYHLVVRHRNHLPAMSAIAVPIALGSPATFDFTLGISQSSGVNGTRRLPTGSAALYAAEGNTSGGVTAADFAAWQQEVNHFGYGFNADYNLSGGVTADDFYLWKTGQNRSSQVPEHH